jgi:hypothetical protein
MATLDATGIVSVNPATLAAAWRHRRELAHVACRTAGR